MFVVEIKFEKCAQSLKTDFLLHQWKNAKKQFNIELYSTAV